MSGFTWRMSWRVMGVWPLGLSAAVMLLLLLTDERARAALWIGPLAAGVHAAFAFAPGDEPALELRLSAPRPIWLTVLERLLISSGLHALLALIAGTAAALMTGTAPALLLLGWLPPLLFLVGLAVLITAALGRASFGALAVIALVIGWQLGGDGAVLTYPALLPLHLYLPDHWRMIDPRAWWINRLCLSAAGVIMFGAAAFYWRDSEKLLACQRAEDT
jgi:hypothetical protein